MKRKLLIGIYFLCYWTGIVGVAYRLLRRHTLILSYHNVLPDDLYDNSLHLGVSHRWSEFARQIEVVRRRFRIVTDLAVDIPRACVITFDDGYSNNIAAASHLRSLGARGTFFVPIEPLDSGGTILIDRVMLWFSYVPPGEYRVGASTVSIEDSNRGGAYAHFFDRMLLEESLWSNAPRLLDEAHPYALLFVSERMAALRFKPMSNDEVDALQSDGHIIGCHSWDHRPLSGMDDERLIEDFRNCAAAKSRFGIDYYCYPFGGVDEVDARSLRACERAGYAAAVLNIPLNPFSKFRDSFALPRESLPQETNVYLIEAKLSGIEGALKRLLGR